MIRLSELCLSCSVWKIYPVYQALVCITDVLPGEMEVEHPKFTGFACGCLLFHSTLCESNVQSVHILKEVT